MNKLLLPLSSIWFIASACTSSEPKACMCEPVVAAPVACVAPVTAGAPEVPIQAALPAPSSDDEIVEMNAPIVVSETKGPSTEIRELREEPIIVEEEEAPVSANHKMIVTHNGLNIRSGPSMSSSIVGFLKPGTEVQMLSREGIWVMISNDQYVSINYLKDR